MAICSFLLSVAIVGAYEIKPGIMHIEYLDQYDVEKVEEIYLYTDDYLKCWDNGVPVQQSGSPDWRRASITPYTWLSFHMEHSKYKQRRIAKEIEEAVYAYHVYPHMAMVPDWFVRYWDLAEAICDYFGIPFDKPTLTDPAEFEALKVKIETLPDAD